MRHASGSAVPVRALGSYYEWKVPGGEVSVLLKLEVIDSISTDLMKAYQAVPRRGVEVGGLLLGRFDRDRSQAVVEGFEPVACEHRRGPSYVLSEGDRRRLERALRKCGASVIGFCRSHTRPGLYLDQDDQGLIASYFTDPRNVFLLIRPQTGKPPAGGFFFWQEGDIHRHSTYLEFPFDSRLVAGESAPMAIAVSAPPSVEPEHPVEVARPAQIAWPALPVFRLRLPKWRTPPVRWLRAGLAVLALAALGVIEYEVVTARAGRAPETHFSVAPALRVERDGNYLRVNWSRDAAVALHAERGTLTIIDGGWRRDIPLDANQLRTGSLAYSPSGEEVNFQLLMKGPRSTATESVWVITPAGVRSPDRPNSAAVLPQTARESPPARTIVKAAPVSKAQSRRWAGGMVDDGL